MFEHEQNGFKMFSKYRTQFCLVLLAAFCVYSNGENFATSYEAVFPFNFKSPNSDTYSCDSGWMSRGTYCYKYFERALSYEDADDSCDNIGGWLATVQDMGDNLFVGNLITDRAASFWIDKDGAFSHFTEPQPSHDCRAVLNDENGMYSWQLVDCDIPLPFVCQSKACLQGEFKCRSGGCIQGSFQHDGENDCGDSSDEWDTRSDCNMAYHSLTSASNTIPIRTRNPYQNGESCIYILEGPVGYRIELEFTEIQTEAYHDVIAVYEGSPDISSAEYVAHFSGLFALPPPKIVSSNNFLIVTFDVDDSSNDRGFNARFGVESVSTVNAQTLEATLAPKFIESPGYNDGKYPINTRSSWIVTAPNVYDVVTVKIRDLQIVEGDTIFVSELGSDEEFITFEGPISITGTSDFFTSVTNKLLISMHSTSLTSAKGFRFEYYLGCDVNLELNFGAIQTPGMYRATVSRDQIKVTDSTYPILRRCVYSITTQGDPGPGFNMVFLASIGLGTGDQATIVLDGEEDQEIPDIVVEVTSGHAIITFTSDIDDNGNNIGFAADFSTFCDGPSQQVQFNSSINVTCELGEIFEQEELSAEDGSITVECLYGGVWSTERFPTCIGKHCGAIPVVQNSLISDDAGETTFQGATVGGTVTYECQSGSVESGSLTIHCEISGSWSVPPVCSRGICGSLGTIGNGRFVIEEGNDANSANEDMNVGTVVSVECEPGFEQVDGLPYLVCHDNISWTDDPGNVRCAPQKCILPQVEDVHLTISPSNGVFDYDTTITATCDTGYIINGEEPETDNVEILCNFTSNGDVALSRQLPECVDKNECEDNETCTAPATCSNTPGSYSCECEEGYTYDEVDGCTDIDECDIGTNGCKHACTNTDPPQKYNCTCAEGFELYTSRGQNGFSDTVAYGEDGDEEPETQRVLNHSCIRATCPRPQVENGNILVPSSKQYFYTCEEITVMCDIGYVIANSTDNNRTSNVSCEESTSQWNDEIPTCIPAKCPPVEDQYDLSTLSIQPYSYVDYNTSEEVDFYDGSDDSVGVVTAICNVTEAVQVIERKLYCIYDFQEDIYRLHGDSLECSDIRIDCGVPLIPGIPDFHGGQTFLGDNFTMECSDGEFPSGKSSKGARTADDESDDHVVECLENGQWDYGNLKCAAKNCSDPGRPHGGKQIAESSYEEKQIVRFKCYEDKFEPSPAAVQCVLNNETDTVQWFVYENGSATNEVYNKTRPECIDMEEPKFLDCPDEHWVFKYDYLHDQRIINPQVTDNKGIKESTVKQGDDSDFELTAPIIEDTDIEWTAFDFEDPPNSANCTIRIRITEEELPDLSCPGAVNLLLNEESDQIIIRIDSGHMPNITLGLAHEEFIPSFSLEPTSLTLGVEDLYQVHIINQTAWYEFGENEFGEKAVCPVAVMLEPNMCKPWAFKRLLTENENPSFSADNSSITVTCVDGYTFHSQSDSTNELSQLRYSCQEGAYTDETLNFGTYIPHCVLVTKTDRKLTFTVRYDFQTPLSDADGDAIVNLVNTTILPQIEALIKTLADCDETKVSPDMNIEDPVQRTLLAMTFSFVILLQDISNTDESKTSSCASYLVGPITRSFGVTLPLWDLSLGNLSATGEFDAGTLNNDAQCSKGEKIQIVSNIDSCVPCPAGYKKSETDGNCDICERDTYQDQAGQDECKPCPPGKGTFREGAVSDEQCYDKCPSPAISTDGNGMFPCEPCSANKYWIDANTCDDCPSGTKTRGPTGAMSVDGCIEPCKTGWFSFDGYDGDACRPCPIGFYANETESTNCIKCGADNTTLQAGSTSIDDCISPEEACESSTECVNGNCAVTESGQIICSCTSGYTGYTCETEVDKCAHNPCFYSGTCVNLPSDEKGYICKGCPLDFNMEEGILDSGVVASRGPVYTIEVLSVVDCQRECLNDSDCTLIVFFEGHCAIYNILEYELMSLVGAIFSNKTAEGEIGDCEGEPNDCDSLNYENDPCLNGGMCQDDVQRYNCLCPIASNFGGERCETENADVCEEERCNEQNGDCQPIPTGSDESSIHFYCQCNNGYTGRFCETDIDECDPNPCWYESPCEQDSNTPGQYTCTCPTNELGQEQFTGVNCENRQDVTDLCIDVQCADCVADYTANQPLCLCGQGETRAKYFTEWLNVDDESDGDFETLEAHQTAYGNAAICNGLDNVISAECRDVSGTDIFTSDNVPDTLMEGYDCTTLGLICNDTDCRDYEVRYICQAELGTCENVNQCIEPYTDDEGERQCNSENTENCRDDGYSITCTCKPGYDGYYCDEDIDECASDPCENGGTCIDAVNNYICSCVSGTTGVNCEEDAENACDPDPCVNEATCVDGIDTYTCTCEEGWTGINCETDIDACQTPTLACRHGGTCVDGAPDSSESYTCECKEPWEGPFCTTIKQVCPTANACQGRGTCYDLVDNFYCACNQGTIGAACDPGQDMCAVADPCVNGGICQQYPNGTQTCECPPKFTGEWCEFSRGFCSDENNVCENGATCSLNADQSDYTCLCAIGFTGRNCEINIDDCPSCGPGTCVDGISKAHCVCPYGKIGEGCSKDIYRDFDICLDEAYVASLRHSFALGSADLSISLWVKIVDHNDDIDILTLFRTESKEDDEPGVYIVSIGTDRLDVSMDIFENGEFIFDGALDDNEWHHVAFTYKKDDKRVVLFVDNIIISDTLDTDSNPSDANLTSYATAILGGSNFEGCVSLVQVWGVYLSPAQVSDIYNARKNDITDNIEDGLLLDWGWGSYIVGQRTFRVSGSKRGLPECTPGQKLNITELTCQDVRDKKPPGDCVSQDEIQVLPRNSSDLENPNTVTLDLNSLFENDNDITQNHKNFESGERVAIGRHHLVHNAFDAGGNRASCVRDIYVPFGDCANVLPDGSTCYSDYYTSYVICYVSCGSGQVMTAHASDSNTCDPSGIINYQNVYVAQRLPPACVTYNNEVTVGLELEWLYNIGSGTRLTIDEREDVETQMRISLNEITGFCDSNCITSEITIEFGRIDEGALGVKLLAPARSLQLGSHPVEATLYDAIVRSATFNFENMFLGVLVQEDTYRLKATYSCSQSNHVAVLDGNGVSVCGPCAIGTFYDSVTRSCEYCPVGTYQDDTGQDLCTNCTEGKTTETYGTTNEADCFDECNPGYYFDGNACEVCPIGEYQPERGRNYCIKCAFGSTTQTNASEHVSACQALCEAGKELEGEVCVDCEVGQYRAAGSLGGCQLCDEDKTTESTGSTSEADCSLRLCDRGKFSVEDEDRCEDCPQNTYKEEGNADFECTACSENERTDDEGSTMSSDCQFFCGAGKYIANDPDTKSCVECPRHTYKDLGINDNYYMEQCIDCSGNRGTSGTGSNSSTQCEFERCVAGQQIVDGDTECSDCPVDSYQSVADPLPFEDLCEPCAEGFGTESEGNTEEADCQPICAAGSQLSIDGGCEPCPRGYFKNEMDRFGNCEACPNDKITPTTGSTDSADCTQPNCAAGQFMDGETCSPCAQGTYNSEKWQSSCTDCPEHTSTAAPGTEIGAISVAECNLFPGTQPYKVDGLLYDVPYTTVHDDREAWISSVEQSISDFFSVNPPLFVAVNVLGATWTRERSVQKTYVLLQVLIDNTGFPDNDPTELASRVETEAGTLRRRFLDYIVNQGTDTTLPITENTNPTVGEMPTSLCVDGSHRSSDGTCDSCPVGEYQPQGTSEVCIPCFSGFSTQEQGSTEFDHCLIECGPGEEANTDNTACQPCHALSHKPDISIAACVICDIGYHGNSDRTQCYVDSARGSYSTANGNIPCGFDTYTDVANLEACIPCPEGRGTAAVGTISLADCNVLCEAGFESNTADTACVPCAGSNSAKNSASRLAALCSPCPDGEHPKQDKTTCLEDSLPGSYSTEEGSQPCDYGSYSTRPNVEECELCPGTRNTTSMGANSIRDCLSQCELGEPCQSRGTCEIRADGHSCTCESDYQGDACQFRKEEVKNFYFIIIFEGDYSSVTSNTQTEDEFRNQVLNSLRLFFQLLTLILDLAIVGLGDGSVRTAVRITAEAETLTSDDAVREFANTIDQNLQDYVEKTLADEESPVKPFQEQEFDVLSEANTVLPCTNGTKYNNDMDNPECISCTDREFQATGDINVCRPCPGDFLSSGTSSAPHSTCQSPCDISGSNYCSGNGECVTNVVEKTVSCDCEGSYSGEHCDVRGDPTDQSETDLIIGLTVGGFLLLLLILSIVGFIIFNRKRRKQTSKSDSDLEPSLMGYNPRNYPGRAYPYDRFPALFNYPSSSYPDYGRGYSAYPTLPAAYAPAYSTSYGATPAQDNRADFNWTPYGTTPAFGTKLPIIAPSLHGGSVQDFSDGYKFYDEQRTQYI